MNDLPTEKQVKAFPFKIASRFWYCYHMAIRHKVDLGFDVQVFEKILEWPDFQLLSDEIEYAGPVDEDKARSIKGGFWNAYSYAARFERVYLGFDFTLFEKILTRPSGVHELCPLPTSSPAHMSCTYKGCRSQSMTCQPVQACHIRDRCAAWR
jgi:hypothetical protein